MAVKKNVGTAFRVTPVIDDLTPDENVVRFEHGDNSL